MVPEVKNSADFGGDDVALQGDNERVGRHPRQDYHRDQHHGQHLDHLLSLPGISDRVTLKKNKKITLTSDMCTLSSNTCVVMKWMNFFLYEINF